MRATWTVLTLALVLPLLTVQTETSCEMGYSRVDQNCVDVNECAEAPEICGENATCFNTDGSYYCQCQEGFRSKTVNFTNEDSVKCTDINECLEIKDICGPNANCQNTNSNYTCSCQNGFASSTGVEIFHGRDNVTCRDVNECADDPEICGENTNCFNTDGSYYCQCQEGFSSKAVNFTAEDSAECKNTDKCKDEKVCGLNASCINTQGIYYCICNAGYALKSGKSSFSGQEEQCEDICKIDDTICGNGSCLHEASGHYCACSAGFTNYGNKKGRCTELHCGFFKDMNNLTEKFDMVQNDTKKLSESCLKLSGSEDAKELNGDDLLTLLLSVIDQLLSAGSVKGNRKISTFLDVVEQVLRFIGPLIKTPVTKRSTNHTELELLVHTGSVIPQELKTLSSKHGKVDIKMKEAAGNLSSYPGFTTVSLLSYSNLEESAKGFYSGMKKNESQSFKINSKVVTVIVSNTDTKHLNESVNITLYHLESNQTLHTCVFWDSSKDGGGWSDRGCSLAESNPNYTVCSCNHLSSFAVLLALYEIESTFELLLISWIGLSLSLICLFFCILTFSMIQSIKSPRTTIHLHLCISLFIATLIFLAGISQTQNKVGCAVVAGMLHFFYLAAFCWMCLEGVQLFRMVVLVFNTNFKTSYMMAGGYGVPAAIVAVTALINRDGYGTKKYCWLNLDLIWSVYGPVCVIITVNIFFFLITVWKLAQKFSSLNPDLDSLHKIKAFTITAVAQLCVLGITWISGCFQLNKNTIAMSYLFTLFGSLQGVMLFVMHCLFSKQVREEYENILSQLRAPRKREYSEFNYSSKANASRSTQDTGESHI
ncbi:adhesion G protein-coupled receptor E5 isoform X2 [Gambusia affinis]|uniref:adhesion G protein-coupled receptor E5 isoform X2 n=1 Tax=Gambusia affinis TaxID=33528 RepID=UPI001CDCAC89|nr:adhesion G protein-coupled receptor E5 isoform X2 [Gambusia affinis]